MPLTQTRLGNGLRVVVQEDRVAPVVAVNLWYDVGSCNEELHRTGLAHLFEHLMFQGSSQVASSDHFALVQSVGGTLNGTTSFDRTNYFESVPSHALDLALWLEADRMGTLLDALTQESLDNQRDVVKNERRQRMDDVPYGTAWEHLYALAYPERHPYNHMPMGSMEHLDATTLDDARSFFSTWYAPGNAVLTVVGDVDAGEALARVEHWFGALPTGPERPASRDGRIGLRESEVIEVLNEAVPAEALYGLYRCPPDGTPEYDALLVACTVLGDGGSSRLIERLVRNDRVATAMHLGPDGQAHGTAGVALIVHAADGTPLDDVRTTLDDELARFAKDGPTPQEMDRALAQLERGTLDDLQTVSDRADQLSRYAVLFGDPELALTVMDRLSIVTAAQVRDVAATYLVPSNRAVVEYRAAPTAQAAA